MFMILCKDVLHVLSLLLDMHICLLFQSSVHDLQ